MKKFLFKSPDNISRIVSSFSALAFLGALLGGAYGVSLKKKKVNGYIFTISQALAFGNKYIMVTLFTLAFAGIIFLNIYRGRVAKFLSIRILLLILVYAFIITIIWVTTYVNKNLHYIFAGIIFISNLLYITLLTYSYQKYLRKQQKYKTYLLDLNLMLAYGSLVLLLTYGIFDDDKSYLDDSIFASNENFTVLLTAITLLYLGFI